MNLDLQPAIGNALVRVQPLQRDDFERLFAVASDPLIWEQHPNPDRYQRAVFENWFRGALESRGALLVFDADSDALIGSSRFYDYDPAASVVLIGYTFLARSHWGGRYNPALKQLMLEHAFGSVERVLFHVGESNRRSRIAMERLGARFVGKAPVRYFGETSTINLIYEIRR